MPLSEQEQRLLDEMERHLMHNDADVVSAPSGGRALSYRNLVYGAILVLLGLGALIAGVAVSSSTLVVGLIAGVAGFAAMLGGVILAVTPLRGAGKSSPRDAATRPEPQRPTSFMDRMNDRWDRRQQGR